MKMIINHSGDDREEVKTEIREKGEFRWVREGDLPEGITDDEYMDWANSSKFMDDGERIGKLKIKE